MFTPLTDLANARILVTNDDGFGAPGLKLLEKIAKDISKDVWVVAPESEQSAAAHSLTLRRPLRLRKISRRHFTVDGTPTDCVLLAVNRVLRDKRPDIVLSGINRGGNLGEDVTYSGTVAAAMEGTLMGIRSFALSQQISPGHPPKWATAQHFAPNIIRKIAEAPWPQGVLININFPDALSSQVTGTEVVRQGKRKLGDQIVERIDPRGEPYIWIGGQRTENRELKGTDLETIHRLAVSITPLQVDFTADSFMEGLTRAINARE